jgi:2-keto-4-pentenoate hydratase
MLDPQQLEDIAGEMHAAQLAARPLQPFTSRVGGFDLPAAYEVAQRIHRRRVAEGATPVGRKIGFTNPEMWLRYGVHDPIWAYVYDHTVIEAATQRARCSIAGFVEPKIEPEIVFGFGAAPLAGGGVAAILNCIAWVAHGFEIVQSHFPGWRFEAPDTVADWGLHATLVIGERCPVERFDGNLAAQLESFSLTLLCDGDVREMGRGSNVLGSPLRAIEHLLSVLARQPMYPALQAGEIVTTGTVTTAHSVCVGQTWTTVVQGIALPGLALEIAS